MSWERERGARFIQLTPPGRRSLGAAGAGQFRLPQSSPSPPSAFRSPIARVGVSVVSGARTSRIRP
eukprot:7532685-Lingulodinium_polyedra.AAC.1